MADVASQYTLTTPGGTILFNDGSTDEYYISDIQGLDGAEIRAPVDPRPQTSGGIVHDFFEGPLRVSVEGVLMIRSTRVMTAIRQIRNEMEADLRDALRSILAADGTLAWTPYSLSAQSLTVRYEVRVEYRYVDNYLNKAFTFGLVSEDPAPT
jgi:hypothetical protein